jgi:biotin carboxyl carrier protein
VDADETLPAAGRVEPSPHHACCDARPSAHAHVPPACLCLPRAQTCARRLLRAVGPRPTAFPEIGDVFKVILKSPQGGAATEVAVERAGGAARETHIGKLADRLGELEVERYAPGDGWLRVRERVSAFHVIRDGERVRVWLAGRLYDLEAVARSPRRAAAATGGARRATLTAPMPGTVLKVAVSRGEAFAAHQPLVILESMKMEMTLSAPHAGRIHEVLCRAGQLVELGAVLLRLEDDHGEPA